MNLMKKLGAEFFGTFWLVLGGCGTAVLAGSSVGTLGISLAFGLTVLTMVYAVGGISGGHFNPAVSFGLWAGGRFSGKDLIPYVVAQVIGAILAAGAIYIMASGKAGFELKPGALASNGYGIHSPGQYPYMAALVAEVLMTFFFLFIILGATDKRAPKGFAGIAIGLALTLIHLISIPTTNTSVNPARSTGPALIEGGIALKQLWFFWVMPIIGGILAGLVYKWFETKPKETE